MRVQDAYSLRCAPQVHGACKDAFAHIKQALERCIARAIKRKPKNYMLWFFKISLRKRIQLQESGRRRKE